MMESLVSREGIEPPTYWRLERVSGRRAFPCCVQISAVLPPRLPPDLLRSGADSNRSHADTETPQDGPRSACLDIAQVQPLLELSFWRLLGANYDGLARDRPKPRIVDSDDCP